ncbi:MAG: ATP-binding protein, partial [Tannerella sp.]|nr:ATP-binding protein [Tannerella sp.]
MAQFKTRARALDLLGRQQIAGIPTAINELIKNAHDAYADKFDIDFLRKDNLLVLRDDGLGMTKDEFETRWLTIGTESKFANKKTTLPPKDNSKPIRPIMGEKGIGRLAIASIGKQVLIISKAKLRDKDYKAVVAFINWELFELPGINLEDITIPVKEFENLPNKEDIDIIKNEVITSLDSLLARDVIIKDDCIRIKKSIETFNSNPLFLNTQLVGDFDFSKDRGGTFFYISPVSETFIFDIEGDKSSKEATPIEKMLIGFHNTMTPNHPKPVIDIFFRDYRGDDDKYFNIIDKEEWFTPDEFELADHHFQGEFDKFGQFKGMVKIYGEKTYDHIVNWKDNNFRETYCGTFKINLAYLQGELKSSRVDAENYSIIRSKGDKFGGLYIYKDNIRILPYGDSDYDYLDIEKNRSKKASTGFFSYRRMFGAIELSAKSNGNLVEKAGREGFIENRAYRQLQAILKNFFVQLAADFFDEKGETPHSEFWHTKRNEINTYYLALKRRNELAKGRKDKFLKELKIFFNNLASRQFQMGIAGILNNARQNLISIVSCKDMEEASQKIIDYEMEARRKIADYKKKITIASPRGFTISKSAKMDFDTYLTEFELLEEALFKSAVNEIDNLVNDYTRKLNIEISKRKRLELSVEQIATEVIKSNKTKKNETNEVVSDVSKKIRELTSDLILDLDNQIRTVRDRFKNLSMLESEDFDLVKERKSMEDDIELISSRNSAIMDRIIRQFEGF